MAKRKEIRQFRIDMLKFFKAYKHKLGINPRWHITIEIRRKQGTFAEVQHCYKKRRFWIYVNDRLNGNINELKDTIIHEFCHILLLPYTHATEEIIYEHYNEKNHSPRRTLKKMENKEEALVRKLTTIILRLDKHE